MAPMSRWDEPAPEAEVDWLRRDLKAAEDVRDALPLGSRDRALVEETIRSLRVRLTKIVSSSGRLGDNSELSIGRPRREFKHSKALQPRADRRQPPGSSGF